MVMSDLLQIQLVHLGFIIVPGLFLSIYLIMSKQDVIKVISSGCLVAFIGLALEVMSGTSFSDAFYLIDVRGVGRAWIVGCMVVFAGTLTLLWNALNNAKK